MISLDRNITVKLELLFLLNDQEAPISSTQLSRLLEPISSATILNYCRELQDSINELYPEELLRLNINESGIYLKNEGTSLLALTNCLLTSDLSYQVIVEVYNNKEVNSLQFCQKYGTSLSTLRRKIRALNQEIASYGFYISSSDRFFIKGDEIKLRNFYAIFLWSIHRKFSSIPLTMELNHYIDLSKGLLRTGRRLPKTQTELLSFFIYATDIRVKNKERIPFTPERQALLQHYEMQKHAALEYWQDSDYFFTHFSFLSYIFAEAEDLEFFDPFPLSTDEADFIQEWISLFEAHFHRLSVKDRRFLHLILKRNLLSERYLEIESNLIPFFVYDDFKGFKTHYKVFLSAFEAFYDQLLEKYPACDTHFYYEFCFYNCLFFVPFKKILTEIKIFCFTDYSYILDNLFKKALQTNFSGRYQLQFVDTVEAADMIIGNLNFGEDVKQMGNKKDFLVVDVPFSYQSIAALEEKLALIEQRKIPILPNRI